jgi:hypothetical protein
MSTVNSWAREYHAGNAALCGVNAALAAGQGYTVNDDMLEAGGGFLAVFSGGKPDTSVLTRPIGSDYHHHDQVRSQIYQHRRPMYLGIWTFESPCRTWEETAKRCRPDRRAEHFGKASSSSRKLSSHSDCRGRWTWPGARLRIMWRRMRS